MRYEDVADLLPGIVDGTVVPTSGPGRSSSPTCGARPSWPGTGGWSAAWGHFGSNTSNRPRGLLAATLNSLAEEGERRVARSVLTGRRLAYAGAALGATAVAGAAATALVMARSRRRLLAS